MNPDTNRLETLTEETNETFEKLMDQKVDEMLPKLFRPDGSPVPKHWAIFTVGEKVVIKNYTFEIKYLGEMGILIEPVGLLDLHIEMDSVGSVVAGEEP